MDALITTMEPRIRASRSWSSSCALSVSLALMNFSAVSTLSAREGAPQEITPKLYQELRYRMIGPHRASRTVGAVGVPSQPGTFYIGVNNGGVWETDDYGRTWEPIFDDAPTGSVGDIAVSPSHPNVLYVGSGEGLHRPDLSVGDGMFRSTDGGKSWRHVGLEDVQQVGRVVVHPTDPDVVFVAGLGHPYGPNEERGVFRTRDGGAHWDKVLYIDQDTGAIQVELEPGNPNVVYADLWDHREGPWENARFSGRESGLYKSTDGGDTWRRLETGLPDADDGLGRIGVGIAPSEPSRLYATVDARQGGGIYRSDNGGDSWRRISTDERLWGRGGDFGEIRVHPKNPDTVFVGNIAAYRSDDGGDTWTSIKGAPGGDDYHRIWIDPERPEVMLFATDQGATVTVNGGRTWSSWYNQPTAQLYHVSTDNRFPYWVYGGQQESGAIGIANRGPGGQTSFREWIGVGADEYAYVAADPLDPNLVYGGRVVRWDRRTGQGQNVAPEALRSGDYRILRTMPLLFHPADPKTLLFATNVLWKTTNGGQSWTTISPDLSRERPDLPDSIGSFRTAEMESMERRGVIYSVAASPLDAGVIWAGTDDGLVHLTRDGGATWHDVTPAALRSWDKVAQIDAGHFDTDTAYLAVNALRRDDQRPHVFKTHDGGHSWVRIVTGMEAMGPVNVVREDPKEPGLLYAGTERQVAFSVDDGSSWHSLRQNMPATSIRDLVIHSSDWDDDLVVGTHGRSIWILDDIAPLRELRRLIASADDSSSGAPHLFSPGAAVRVRWNVFSDTPLPPEEPGGENPPDGAVLDYLLPRDAESVELEILSREGDVIRRFSSQDEPEQVDPATLPHPTYWIRPAQQLPTTKGHHRFVWDLRHAPPRGARRQFAISAVLGRTPSGPQGPFTAPGDYRVRLTVDGDSLEQELEVVLDPRVELDQESIDLQTDASMRCYRAYHQLQDLSEAIGDHLSRDGVERLLLETLRGDRAPGNPDTLYGSIYATAVDQETVTGLQHKLLFLLDLLQAADARPTAQALSALETLEAGTQALRRRFVALE